MELEEHQIKMEEGDLLVFYTDGVIHALSSPQRTGDAVLRELITINHFMNPSVIVDEIKSKAIKSEVNPDDLVLAILKREK